LATASATWRWPAQRVSLIFGDGQRNLATACATRIFYLWRRPAQLGDGPRNWLTPGNTELGETSATRNVLSLTLCCLLSLATASATWRRPAQRASFIFSDGQRNLATTAQRVSLIFGNGQRNLATAGSSFIFDSGGQCKCDNVQSR